MEKRCVIKNIVYFLEIMLMFVVQQIPLLSLQYFGVRAIFIIPAFVCVSVFMNEKQAMWFGVISGIFLDMELSNVFGIHILMLFLLGYAIGFVFEHVMKINVVSAIITCLIVTLIVVFVRFLLFYVCKGYDEAFYAFKNYYLSSVLYTVVVTPVLYLFNRSVSYYAHGRGGV